MHLPPIPTVAPGPAGPLAHRSILVVDDTSSAREPLARLLRLAGYDIACAADGAQALTEMERHTPDLVLLDLMMPHVDGLSFLKSIRTDPRFDRVPVILVTAADTPDSLATARRLGIHDCLLKANFTIPELLDRIAKTLHPN